MDDESELIFLKIIREHIVFILLVATALLLRLLPLFNYEFTLDEWSGLGRTRFDNYSDLLDQGVKIDAHPALVQTLLYLSVKLFGFSNGLIKLPFLLSSIGAIIYAYCFGLKNFSKQAALVAVIFFSFSLIFVYYAPIARMYIPGVFFSTALLYHFYEIAFKKNANKFHYFYLDSSHCFQH